MARTVIKVDDIAKRYRIDEADPRATLGGKLVRAAGVLFGAPAGGGKARGEQVVWALKGVSFEVGEGEVVGIIGRNGSGKSTLLRILSRVTRPTRGTAEIQGRIGTLLGIGTGFHPELTGRENVYMSGAVLGMKEREIAARFDEIVAFGGIEPFLDIPVRRHSTGMYARLALAVAAHLRADVLLLDEALAVGDIAFRRKCFAKMRELAGEGRTVLLVSHDPITVQSLAEKTLLLEGGHLVAYGETNAVMERYFEMALGASSTVYDLERTPRDCDHLPRLVELLRLEIEEGQAKLRPSQPLRVLATVRGNAAVGGFRFLITILRVHGGPVGSVLGREIDAIEPGTVATYRVELPDLPLASGHYHCVLAAAGRNGRAEVEILDSVRDVLRFEVAGPRNGDAPPKALVGWSGPVRLGEPRIERIA